MRLAVFDLDHTLLAADSDFAEKNRRFYADYAAGKLDVEAFYRFSLAPLAMKSIAEWQPLRERFLREIIAPVVAPLAPALLERHRAAGDTLLITTATQRFITEPIAALLGIEHLLATEPEILDGRLTGRLLRANFQAGKVDSLKEWIASQSVPVTYVAAYSDSRNDIPLLASADEAIAVDPDPALREEALRRGWPVISLRGEPAAL